MKHLTSLLLVLLLLLTMTACSASGPAAAPNAADQQMLQTLDALERRLAAIEDSLAAVPTAAPAPRPEPAAPAKQPTVPQPTAAPSLPAALTKEEAQQIALDHVGFTADQVDRMRSNYEIDDGLPQYDVEFFQGDWEYEFEIHAEDGRILSYDKDHKYD